MKQRINSFDFVNAFKKSDTYKNSFSNLGLYYLYKHLENYEEETGEELELDIVAIACEYTEYEDINEAVNEYQIGYQELQHSTDIINIYEWHKYRFISTIMHIY